MSRNTLYYGDNLKILREHIADGGVDLVYLDPPFNSNQNYNILFREENGSASAAQVQAFEDSWHWNEASEEALEDITQNAPARLVDLIRGFLLSLGRNQFTAYLVMMTPRLLELHRVLNSTGSFYLHCDPTASHYLKIVLDQIFAIKNFRNEIIWCYTRPSNIKKRFPRVHHVLLFYTKTDDWIFNRDPIRIPYHPESEARSLRGAGTKSVMGAKGLDRLHPEGKVPEDWWLISELQGNASERLGYPTQKPERLLRRIILASSNEGDLVLDPFCGCGTTITVAEQLHRRWIGIDITHLAIALMKNRLEDTFGDEVDYEVVGEPVDLSGAHALARQDRYQFQWWALSLVRARPVDQKKKGSDRGVDGVKYININPTAKKPEVIKVIVQVKSGHVSVKDIREFRTIIGNSKAQMGAFVTLNDPTAPMVTEALAAGYYTPNVTGAIAYPRIQILTVEELLNGKKLNAPLHDDSTFRKAQRQEEEVEEHPHFLDQMLRQSSEGRDVPNGGN